MPCSYSPDAYHGKEALQMALNLGARVDPGSSQESQKEAGSQGGVEMLQWKQMVGRLLLALKMDRGWAREMEKTGK